MKLAIIASLEYELGDPVDLMLHIEAAIIPEQIVTNAILDISAYEHFARVPAQDGIGERIWLRCVGYFRVQYSATVEITRVLTDYRKLDKVPMHMLPGETVQYLNESRYCPSHQFLSFVESEFGNVEGGAKVGQMRDWIKDRFTYVAGSSDANTTALESFVERRGVCRDYAHVMVTLTRAAGIPARVASVYALGVQPQDFHAVAEVFLGGEWHLVDATGMAREADMAKIGVGRDAADIAFLTAYAPITMVKQTVSVRKAT